MEIIYGLQRGELLVSSTFFSTEEGMVQRNTPYIVKEQELLKDEEVEVLLQDEIIAGSNDVCTICFDDLLTSKAITVRTVCNHVFCRSCFKSWLGKHTNCPMCRVDFKQYF